MAKAKKQEAQAWMYDIVRKPIVTEKSARGSENGQMTFEVAIDSTKPQIKTAVETLFEVEVKAVNTLVQKFQACIFFLSRQLYWPKTDSELQWRRMTSINS